MDDDVKNTNGNIHDHEHQKIEVISGDGNIDISEVHNHLNIESPVSEDSKRKTIVIPPENSQNS